MGEVFGNDIEEDWANDLLDCRSLRHFADFFECRSVIFADAREGQIRDMASIQSCNVLGRFAFAPLRKCSKNS